MIEKCSQLNMRSILAVSVAVVLYIAIACSSTTDNPSDQEQQLIDAIFRSDVAAVRSLIESGVSVEAKDKNGATALHIASTGDIGSYDIAKLLVENGANIEAVDDIGGTPLHSSTLGNVEIARLLIDEGSDIEALDDFGRTPIHLATIFDSADVVSLLIERGANLEASTDGGITPLHEAAYQGSLEVVRLLIDGGANIEVEDEYGETPLDVYLSHPDGYSLNLDACFKSIYGPERFEYELGR